MRAPAIRLTLLFVVTAALGADDPIPWPGGEAPSVTSLQAQVDDARDRLELARAEAMRQASDPDSARASITVLQEDIDAGRWDNDDLFELGAAVFEHAFRDADGFGAAPHASLRRVHFGDEGGPDTFACADCHQIGGPGGAGAITQNTYYAGDGDRPSQSVIRNAPHVLGLGFVQALAAEMTDDLHMLREEGEIRAAERGESIAIDLVTKGVAFGRIVVDPDGRIDTSEVQGIDRDLVVRPFGRKGTFATLRRIVEHEARVHFGIEVAGPDEDPDGDGKTQELPEGTLTATAVYLAMQASPVILPPHDPALRDRWVHGSALFDAIGCGTCHRRELELHHPFWEEAPDTTDGDPVRVSLLDDGDLPKASPRVALFSDLKRHDMGSALADAESTGDVAASEFVTRPLWGLAETAPYLHDGRAATIPEAIEAHGGTAAEVRDAYLELADRERADLHVFLLSLTRAPTVRFAR